MSLPWECQPASTQPRPNGSLSPVFADSTCTQIYLDSTQTFCPACPSMVFPEKSQGKLTSRAILFACVAPMGVGLLSSCVLRAGSHGEASASCSKFLMTTFHLKSSLALREANIDSSVSQDNLARKYSDEFRFFLRWGMSMKKKTWNRNINSRELMQHRWSKAISRDAWWSFEFKEVRWCFIFLLFYYFNDVSQWINFVLP